jgi:hypothetical protein
LQHISIAPPRNFGDSYNSNSDKKIEVRMLQIRKVRTLIDAKTKEKKRYDAPNRHDVIVKDHTELFANLSKYLDLIPEKERYNQFYTIGHCSCEQRRDWIKQDIIPFDIDGIATKGDKFDKRYVELALKALGADPEKTVVVFSGHGIQIIIQMQESIEDHKYFQQNRLYYKLALNKIGQAYEAAGLKWKLDPTSFAPNRILRLPGTVNRKEGKPDVRAYLITSKL